MKCAGTLQVVMPWLRGPDRFTQLMAAEVMLQMARDESSFDAIITAGICRVGMYCRADCFCNLSSTTSCSMNATTAGLSTANCHENKCHFLQHFSSYVLVYSCIFGQQPFATGALPSLHLLSASPIEDPGWETKEDEWIIARALFCVLATAKEQGSSAAELSGSILHMPHGHSVMISNFDTQSLHGMSQVYCIQRYRGDSHVD